MTPVERFRELLTLPTVSHADTAQTDVASFDRFREALERLHPLVHRNLDREIVAGHALLYRWRGASPADPLLLLAHQDVVDTAGQLWTRDPFGPVKHLRPRRFGLSRIATGDSSRDGARTRALPWIA